MSNLYFLNDEEREKLLEGICDQCIYCYRGLDDDVFELTCSKCVPVKFLSDLEPIHGDLLLAAASCIAFKKALQQYKKEEGDSNE